MTVTVISKNVGRVSEEGINDSMTLYSNKTFYLYLYRYPIERFKVFHDFTVISIFRSFKPLKE